MACHHEAIRRAIARSLSRAIRSHTPSRPSPLSCASGSPRSHTHTRHVSCSLSLCLSTSVEKLSQLVVSKSRSSLGALRILIFRRSLVQTHITPPPSVSVDVSLPKHQHLIFRHIAHHFRLPVSLSTFLSQTTNNASFNSSSAASCSSLVLT